MKTLLLSDGERSDAQYEWLRIFSGFHREYTTTWIDVLFLSELGDERARAERLYTLTNCWL